MTNVSFENILLNFGFGSKEEKKRVLEENSDKNVYMDLTCYDPAEFYSEFPQLKGSFAALFCDEEKKIEVHYQEKDERVQEKLKELGFYPVETTIVSCGFIFPRTIVQIINEAYFALAEGVASKEDINRAMKFGVNYPKGPFEWSEGRETIVKTLLSELLTKTQDKRYLPSPLL
ncbi:MAG: 3-hydroxyacyl-CoA dehydrogenase family protein [Bacteriovoracia bacterium]